MFREVSKKKKKKKKKHIKILGTMKAVVVVVKVKIRVTRFKNSLYVFDENLKKYQIFFSCVSLAQYFFDIFKIAFKTHEFAVPPHHAVATTLSKF